MFRSDSKDYKQYEAVTKRFPATEFDVLVVVEGKTLLARENLEKIRDMVTDLQLVEGVRGLVSLFSARQAPEPGKLPAALFPPELPQGAAYEKFTETVKSNEIIRGKLLSEDGTLALIVLSLEPQVRKQRRKRTERCVTSRAIFSRRAAFRKIDLNKLRAFRCNWCWRCQPERPNGYAVGCGKSET